MRIKMLFSYDGSKFEGFQRQKDSITVQGTIENALKSIFDENIEIKGSGRTDSGVHANGQVAHCDIPFIPDSFVMKLNMFVNPNIVIKKIKLVKDDFDARRDVKKKEYVYKIYLGKYKSSLRDYKLQINYKINISLMKEASKYMIGTHDFRNFVAGKRDDYVTTIYSIDIRKVFGTLEISFIGTGFYRYMVRNLVGALLEVGKMKVSFLDIEKMINKPLEKKGLPTASSVGLYLQHIWY